MATGIKAGDAYWDITANIDGLRSGLSEGEGAVNKSTTNISQSMATVGKGMTAIGAAISAPFILGVSEATSFGSAMSAVATLGVEDVGGLEDAVRSVAVEYGQDLTGAAKGAYQAISAGVDAAEAPRVLEEAAKAAAAGQSDLTTAIELGTAMTNAFGGEMSNMGGIFDTAFVAVKDGVTTFEELSASAGKAAPAFSAAGLSADEMFGSVAALTKGGINTAESFTSLNALIASFTRQGEMSKLETLGLQGALEWLKETTDGDATAMLDFLGSTEAMKAALALTGNQAESFNAIMEDMKNKTGATGEAFKIIAETDPAFAWAQLKATMQDLAITIGQALLPTLKNMLDFITPAIQAVASWAKEHDTLAASIAIVAAGFGALMLAVGPILMAIPGLIALFGAVGTVAGTTSAAIGVAGGAAGLVGAMGAFGAAALMLAPALIPIVIGIGGIAIAARENKDAYDQLALSEENLKNKNNEYVAALKEKGVALDEAAMKSMSFEEQQAYMADAEKSHADTLARAWFEYYAGRTESEQEFGQMRNLMLNDQISAEEAAQITMKGLKADFIKELMTMSEEETNAYLENMGIKETTETETLQRMTEANYQAAAERNAAFMEATHSLVENEKQAAAEIESTWSQYISGIWEGLKSLIGFASSNNVNLPVPEQHAEGGMLSEGYNIVGERGPEAIIKSGAEARVVTAENTNVGGITVNMNASIASDMDVEKVAQKLGAMLQQRMTGIGRMPVGQRI